MSNAWTDRFDPKISEEDLKALAQRKVVPLTDLARDGIDVAKRRLKNALREIFVPTAQLCLLLRQFIAAAHVHVRTRYPDRLAFVQAAYAQELPASWSEPIGLTGLAGVGKSALLSAFARVLPRDSEIEIAGHGRFPLVAAWLMTAGAGMSLESLIRPRLRDSGSMTRTVQPAARRELLLTGVGLLGVDEFQLITQSDANVKVAKILMQLSSLGPPLIYCANFSLLHRLLLRPHEERQRLFSNLIVLEPDAPQSGDWIKTLREQLRVAPEFDDLDAKLHGGDIHRYTAGLPRLSAKLLVIAYGFSRERRGKRVGMVDVESAYRSAEFAIDREDVELLSKQAITGELVHGARGNIRKDLWCPIGRRHASNVTPAEEAIAHHQSRVNESMVASSLRPDEREGLRQKNAEAKNSGKKSAVVVRIRRPPVTKESLTRGAAEFAKESRRAKGSLKDT
jgi:hypothetical protein